MTAWSDTRIAGEIVAEHEAVGRANVSALQHARRAGTFLRLAKRRQRHGSWLDWLAEHCKDNVSERTAQDYMRVSKGWPKLNAWIAANPQRAADLSIRAALEFLKEAEAEQKRPEQLPDAVVGVDLPVPVIKRTVTESVAEPVTPSWSVRADRHQNTAAGNKRPPQQRRLSVEVANMLTAAAGEIRELEEDEVAKAIDALWHKLADRLFGVGQRR